MVPSRTVEYRVRHTFAEPEGPIEERLHKAGQEVTQLKTHGHPHRYGSSTNPTGTLLLCRTTLGVSKSYQITQRMIGHFTQKDSENRQLRRCSKTQESNERQHKTTVSSPQAPNRSNDIYRQDQQVSSNGIVNTISSTHYR